MPLTKKQMGDKIKETRKLKSKSISEKYTQVMLAKDIHKSQGYIGDIESGRTYPTYIVLSNICNACNVSLSFFDDENIINNIESE